MAFTPVCRELAGGGEEKGTKKGHSVLSLPHAERKKINTPLYRGHDIGRGGEEESVETSYKGELLGCEKGKGFLLTEGKTREVARTGGKGEEVAALSAERNAGERRGTAGYLMLPPSRKRKKKKKKTGERGGRKGKGKERPICP